MAGLGYGTQRQLEIGLALLQEPLVLLLDEPTAGMSPRETLAMVDLLAGLPSGLALLVIEHDMDVVFRLAERITVLDYGARADRRHAVGGAPLPRGAAPLSRRRGRVSAACSG